MHWNRAPSTRRDSGSWISSINTKVVDEYNNMLFDSLNLWYGNNQKFAILFICCIDVVRFQGFNWNCHSTIWLHKFDSNCAKTAWCRVGVSPRGLFYVAERQASTFYDRRFQCINKCMIPVKSAARDERFPQMLRNSYVFTGEWNWRENIQFPIATEIRGDSSCT